MERVVTINLNGNPYQLEEPAYDALRAYMDRATAALADNPDKAEIIRDLEQAIADKCGGYLSPSKTVIAAAEMARIITEMGPVEGDGADAPRPKSGGPTEGPRKRLYRIKDRAIVAGVCSGIGAYFDIDANIIRVLFIVGTLFTSGFGLLLYLILMFAVPSAHTSEEWAAAHGVPFNAQEVIDRAKREYNRFADDNGKSWRAQMRAQRRAWNEQMRGWQRSWDHGAGPVAAPAQPVGYVTRVFAGLLAFIFSIITAALLIAFLIALFSLLGTGELLGWSPPGDVPGWLVIVILCITYAAISAPFSALRRTSFATVSGQSSAAGATDGFFTLMIALIAAWFAWVYVPEARELMEQAYLVVRDFVSFWSENWFWN
ncbi:MAG: PspC domain-containing protein [Hyphomonadaceae bacterium]